MPSKSMLYSLASIWIVAYLSIHGHASFHIIATCRFKAFSFCRCQQVEVQAGCTGACVMSLDCMARLPTTTSVS